MRFSVLTVALLASAAAAHGAPTSVYTKLNDSNVCAAEISATDEGGGDNYDCPGPISGTGTLLMTGADWDHLHLLIDGKQYSLWAPMVAVGSWSGIGNEKGLAEWRFTGKTRSRAMLQAFIVRFNGTILGSDGDTKGTRSQLAVFGLTPGNLCWKGNFATNAAARKAAASGACKTMLTAEEPGS